MGCCTGEPRLNLRSSVLKLRWVRDDLKVLLFDDLELFENDDLEVLPVDNLEVLPVDDLAVLQLSVSKEKTCEVRGVNGVSGERGSNRK